MEFLYNEYNHIFRIKNNFVEPEVICEQYMPEWDVIMEPEEITSLENKKQKKTCRDKDAGLIIENNTIYEIDEECIECLQKQRMELM